MLSALRRLLPLLALLALTAGNASGLEPSLSETRIRGFDLGGAPRIGGEGDLSRELHWGIGEARTTLASDSLLAAEAGGSNLLGQSFGKLGTVVENPGLELSGFTTHGFEAASARGLTWDVMQGVVESPSVVLQQSAGQYLYLSNEAAVVLNPAGQVMTTYPAGLFDPAITTILRAAGGAP